jgi:hypothetical protein
MKGVDPVDHRLMVNRQESPESAKALAFKVKFGSQLFGLVVITERLWLRRIAPVAQLALITLAAGACKFSFDLSSNVLAMGTNNHVKGYIIIQSDLDTPPVEAQSHLCLEGKTQALGDAAKRFK